MSTKKIAGIKHVFFDLDHTLWDFEKNSESVIEALLVTYDVEKKYGITNEAFIKKYKKINKRLWHLYSHKKITKEELRNTRFTKTLERFGVENEELGKLIEKEYISGSPYQTNLMEGTNEILDYLQPKYELHILTNGFKEVQHIKLHESGIKKHFNNIFISEEIGFQKPEREIFELARKTAKVAPHECIMIGDSFENDIQGALNADWKAVYFSSRKKRIKNKDLYQINNLLELKELL